MNIPRLIEILNETTVQLRKGPVLSTEQVNGLDVAHIYIMPDQSDAPDSLVKVDCSFVVIGVDPEKAERYRNEILEILVCYPSPERLSAGPSYIEVGAEIGDQGAAFQLFALGKVLGLWDIITPEKFGLEGAEATAAAVSGYVMMTGYKAA